MMTRIYAQQLCAVDEFRDALQRWNKQRQTNDHGQRGSATDDTRRDPSMDLEVIEDMTQEIRARKAEIEELAGAAERSCQNVKAKRTHPERSAEDVH